jgi:hypothetical protein
MLRKFKAAAAIAAVSVLGSMLFIGGSANAAGDKDCSDFGSHKQAQKYFKKHGGSRHYNYNDLDSDHDGQACEELP